MPALSASKSKRDPFFDNAKFFLIFLVVFSHAISPIKETDPVLFGLYTTIFLFHMPGFILISGYFSKGFQKKGYLIKTAKKTLIPYLIFQLIYAIFYFFDGEESVFHVNFFQPHWTLWFLMSLFFWNVLLFAFARFRWIGLAVSIIIGCAIGFIPQVGEFLSISRTFVFFPLFFLGYLMKQEHFDWLKNKVSLKLIGVAVMAAVFAGFYFFMPQEGTRWLLGSYSYEGIGDMQWYDGIIRLIQYGMMIGATFAFLTFMPKSHSTITSIGTRTMYIYLLHGFIIKTIEAVANPKQLVLQQLGINLIIILAFSIIVCVILGSRPIKRVTKPIIEFK